VTEDSDAIFDVATYVPDRLPARVDPISRQPTFADQFRDAVMLQPFYQLAEDVFTAPRFEKRQNYDPFERIDGEFPLAGYEPYLYEFIDAGSPEEVEYIKAKIRKNEDRRVNASQLGVFGALASELVNPVNYLPLPAFSAARGLASGARLGGASVGAVMGAEEILRQNVDPTATIEESVLNTVVGGLFGAAIGGIAGVAAKAAGKSSSISVSIPDVNEVTRKFINETKPRIASENIVSDEAPFIVSTTGFQARPTTRAGSGIKPAFGLEKLNKMTLHGQLKATGIRAVGDFADAFLGDFGTMSVQNAAGEATHASLNMNQSIWRGMTVDFISDFGDIYASYRSQAPAEAFRIGSVDLPTNISKLRSGLGLGSKSAMEFNEFADAVFRANTREGIKADDPFVEAAAKRAQMLMERVGKELMDVGLLPSRDGFARLITRKYARFDQLTQRFNEISAKKKLTPRERVAKELLGDEISRMVTEFSRRLREDVSDTVDEFADSIGKKLDDRKSKMTPIEREMAFNREMVERLDNLRRERVLTDSEMEYLKFLQRTIDEHDKIVASGVKSREALMDKVRLYVESINLHLGARAQKMPVKPPNEATYLTRIWKLPAVLERTDELRAILRKWFIENPIPGASTAPEAIERRVEKAIANILKMAEANDADLLDNFMPGASAQFLKSRALDIPNELVADFIETDIVAVIRHYMERAGALIEMARMFGDTSADDAIGDVLLQASKEIAGGSEKEIREALESLRSKMVEARDTYTGRIYDTSEVMMEKRRMARNLRAYGIMTSLGGAALSSIPEAVRPMMVHGFERTFGSILDAMHDQGAFKQIRKEVRDFIGVGGETFLAAHAARFVHNTGPTAAARGKVGQFFDKAAEFAGGHYFTLNLLAPFTDLTKSWSGFVTTQYMLDDIAKFAAGKDDSVAELLASYGIDRQMAKRIASQPFERDGRLIYPNFRQWNDDEALRAFLAAVNATTNRIIPTASRADIPQWAKGFIKGREYPLLTLPFQFMNYGFAAVNKVLLSAAQGRDRSPVLGVAALMGFGYMVEAIKTPDYIFDKMTATERAVRAFDRSGVAGVLSDFPTMVETATMGKVGVRPLLGLEPFQRNSDYFDAVGVAGGSVGSRAADVARLLVNGDTDANEVAGTIRRSLPLNNLFYWKGFWKDVFDSVADGVKPDVPEDAEPITFAGA